MADLVQQHESDDEKVAIVACLTIMSVAVTANYFAVTRKRRHSGWVRGRVANPPGTGGTLGLGYLRNSSELGSDSNLLSDA